MMSSNNIRVCGVTGDSEPAGGGGNMYQEKAMEILYRRLVAVEERVYRLEHPEEFDDKAILEECK